MTTRRYEAFLRCVLVGYTGALLLAALASWAAEVGPASDISTATAPAAALETSTSPAVTPSTSPAAVAEAAPGPPRPAGWVKQTASLLFYDPPGALSLEIGLGASEEAAAGRLSAREISAGASPNGRFAWTLDRTLVWNSERSKLLDSKRLLRFFGSNGKELWSTPEVDAPRGAEPLVFSADGETLVLCLRAGKGWKAEVRNYLGASLLEAGPFPILGMVTLTPNGRYALARWSVPDESATHTFLEVPTKRRKDIPSGELYLGLARITEEGRVYSGKKFVYSFAADGSGGGP